MNKLKPVVFVQGDRAFHRDNEYNQNLLIKAMSEGITNPKKLRDVAGLSSVAEVYRTFDKIAIRKDYQKALQKNGIDLNFIVSGIKELAVMGVKETTRLKSYEILLKSLGLDKYDDADDAGKNWEELIVEASEKKEEEGLIIEAETDYEVIRPQTPIEEKMRQDDEKEVAKQLYED